MAISTRLDLDTRLKLDLLPIELRNQLVAEIDLAMAEWENIIDAGDFSTGSNKAIFWSGFHSDEQYHIAPDNMLDRTTGVTANAWSGTQGEIPPSKAKVQSIESTVTGKILAEQHRPKSDQLKAIFNTIVDDYIAAGNTLTPSQQAIIADLARNTMTAGWSLASREYAHASKGNIIKLAGENGFSGNPLTTDEIKTSIYFTRVKGTVYLSLPSAVPVPTEQCRDRIIKGSDSLIARQSKSLNQRV